VRISKKKMKFAKARGHNFITEIFRIVKVIDRRPRAVYELEDLNGTPIDGQFYQDELTPYASPVRPTCGVHRNVQAVQLVVSAAAIAQAFQRLDMSA